jgi:small conductance mechanosensitive channel
MNEFMQKFIDRGHAWILTFGPRILLALVVFIVGQWLIRIFNGWMIKVMAGRKFDKTLRPFLLNLLQIAFQILLILVLMQIIGIRMTLFAAFVGAFGVAIGLALSGTLQNFASGMLIILLKPFRVGDNIRTQGEEGTVTAIRLFYTVVLTLNNTTLIIPNNKFSNDVIFNLTRQKKRRVEIMLKFGLHADLDMLRNIVMKTAESFEDTMNDPQPEVGIEKIEPDGYTVVIHGWINSYGFQENRLRFNEQLMHNLRPMLEKK